MTDFRETPGTPEDVAARADEFDEARLVAILLRYVWQRDCEIVPDYMPPFPDKTTRPTCVIRYKPTGAFLRFSNGPMQGYFWDMYGGDFKYPEWALVALSNAPPPPRATGIWGASCSYERRGLPQMVRAALSPTTASATTGEARDE